MPSPYTAATASTTTALAYSTQRHIEQLCDGSFVAAYQTSATNVALKQITNASGTPTFTTLAQSFTVSGASNLIADLYVVNNGTTTSDVWVAYCDNNTQAGLFVAHATYTASGSSWSWDNTGTSIALGSFNNGFMVPSVVWTGAYVIVAVRGQATNYGITLTYTATKNGSTGWSTLATLDGGNDSSHDYPVLLHDAVNSCSVIVYTRAGDTLYARVLADASTPATANWSAATTLASSINVGAANVSATLDTANKRLHVTYINTGVSTNPQYVNATYTTTSLSAGSPISVDSGATTATGCVIGLDTTSPPKAYVFWASGAVGSASDVNYATIASPYTSASATTNLTNNSAHDNAYPHVPTLAGLSGFVPVLYAFAVSPWTVEFDNSITLASSVSGAGVIQGSAKLTASGSAAGVAAGAIKGNAKLAAAAYQTLHGAAAIKGAGQLAASTGLAGTGIGDIVRSTGTQYANKSGNGYGAGDISGTEYDYRYTDATGSGWAIGANPWYGGMPSSAWYQIDPALNATLPQRTSKTGNQMSLLTTQSGGIVHWEEDSSGGYQSSELLTFQNTGNFTELAPANTPFRAYVKAIGDAPDGNGISWTSYMCAYPGDPGLVVFRFDQHNGTASGISVDESDIELIASLLTDTGSNPTGAWNASNGFIGTIGGSITNGWPADSVHTNGTLDFCGITPDASSGLTLGTGAAVIADPSVQFGWSQGGYETHISAASGSVPGRIKFGFYSDVTSAWTIPAGQTNTYYVLRVFRRNLTATDMAAIAADFKYPGTPSVTTGSFTSFVVDERAYQFAASNNNIITTLDMSPAHVTVRYKPVIKITNWTTTGAPSVTWGGNILVAGSDYRYYTDTTNHTLYIQLYFDVVSGSPKAGQRANAALAVQGAINKAATLQGHGALAANNRQTVAITGTITERAGLSAAGQVQRAGGAAIQGHAQLKATATQVQYGAAALKGKASLVATYAPNTQTSAAVQGRGGLQATGSVVTLLPTTPLSASSLMAITDNIAKALLDIQAAFVTNVVNLAPTLTTMQNGIRQLTSRITSFFDLTQEAALLPSALASAEQAIQFLSLNQTNFYSLYGSLLVALDRYTGGLSTYLTQQQVQVHPQFAAAFNYVAQYAPTLQLSATPLIPIGPQSILLTNPMTLGSLVYTTSTTIAYSAQAQVDRNFSGDAPLALLNTGALALPGGATMVLSIQQWNGQTTSVSATLPTGLAAGASQLLGVSGVGCSAIVYAATPQQAGGLATTHGQVTVTPVTAGSQCSLIAEPARAISY